MSNSRICVAVRKRPAPPGGGDVVETPSPQCIVNEPKIKYDLTPYTDRHTFNFDEVFGDTCNNQMIYERVCLPLIDTVFSRGNATCFAYGQTGSGKTYTMLGSTNEPGLYAISAKEIFARAKKIDADVFVSFYEIYGRKIFDLLNNHERLFAREDGDKVINICGLSEHPVNDIEQIFDVITAGSQYRAAGQTSANSESSRSHAVLQVEVRERTGGRRGPKSVGRISFIDLAGNERGADTFDCDRKTRMEGAEINKSLLALKECIRALGMGKNHVPFRGSILTEVLRDSFTGNSRTTMIATISPVPAHCVNTLNTLRYTQRVKEFTGGGVGGGAKIEQIPGQAQQPARKQPRRKTSEVAPIKRPEWVSDFANDNAGDDNNGNINNNNNRNSNFDDDGRVKVSKASGGKNLSPRSKDVIKVKDPKIATIVQNHLKALEDDDGDDDDMLDSDDDSEEVGNGNNNNNNNGREGATGALVMPKEEERQVRKVHAYVIQEISKAEEKLVALHRRHIDAKMTGIKDEIGAIQAFEDSDSVDDYVQKVRTLLTKQRNDMDQILNMLNSIGEMLKDEEDLSNTLGTTVKR